MEILNKFFEEYEKLKILYPQLYVNIYEARKGNFWRVQICAHEMAIIGDAELLTAEAETRDEALKEAVYRMNLIPSQIYAAIELKRSGRDIHREEIKRHAKEQNKEKS